jgi:hypothetical protein
VSSFIPALSKLEAVARISDLTESGPEYLGPGSKEHKRVFINLAVGLDLPINPDAFSKQDLAREIIIILGGVWSPHFESTGATITLLGLNRMLELATVYNGEKTLSKKNLSVEVESTSIGQVITRQLQKVWDGRSCVTEMRDGGSVNWRQTEWQGFYFEYRVLGELINKLGGGPISVGSTTFDYKYQRIWDLKVHSEFGSKGPAFPATKAPLNDKLSMNQVVRDHGGLGLLILSGEPVYSSEFTTWHKNFRGQEGNSIRQLKESFKLTKLEAFFISDISSLEYSLASKILEEFHQGKQPTGEPRAPKYSIDLGKARKSEIHLATFEI